MKTSTLVFGALAFYFLVIKPKEAAAAPMPQQQLPPGATSGDGSTWFNFASAFLNTATAAINAASKADAQPQAKP